MDRTESLLTAPRSDRGWERVAVTHEVRALSGDATIRDRCLQLLAETDEGIVFVTGDDGPVTINRR